MLCSRSVNIQKLERCNLNSSRSSPRSGQEISYNFREFLRVCEECSSIPLRVLSGEELWITLKGCHPARPISQNRTILIFCSILFATYVPKGPRLAHMIDNIGHQICLVPRVTEVYWACQVKCCIDCMLKKQTHFLVRYLVLTVSLASRVTLSRDLVQSPTPTNAMFPP